MLFSHFAAAFTCANFSLLCTSTVITPRSTDDLLYITLQQTRTEAATMARPIYKSELPIYTGDFSFDETRLKELIKVAKPDYDPINPRTWPVITSKYLKTWLNMPYTGSNMLPSFVAYDCELVRSCLQGRPDKVVKVTAKGGEIATYSTEFIIFHSRYCHLVVKKTCLYSALSTTARGFPASPAEHLQQKARIIPHHPGH